MISESGSNFIAIINYQWILDCVEQRMRLPIENYQVVDSELCLQLRVDSVVSSMAKKPIQNEELSVELDNFWNNSYRKEPNKREDLKEQEREREQKDEEKQAEQEKKGEQIEEEENNSLVTPSQIVEYLNCVTPALKGNFYLLI